MGSALRGFGIETEIIGIARKPSMAEFRMRPRPNIGIGGVAGLSSSVGLDLTTESVQVRTPVPKGRAVNVRIPGRDDHPMLVDRVVDAPRFRANRSPLATILKLSVSKGPVIASLQGVPRNLVTNTAKSKGDIYVGAVLMDLLCGTDPSRLGLLLVSPGVIRLTPCGQVPRLIDPIVASMGTTATTLG